METFATPANFLSETAALLVERVFTLGKRDRRSLERSPLGPGGGVGTPQGVKEAGREEGDRRGRAVESNRYFFFRVIYYRREFERTRAF